MISSITPSFWKRKPIRKTSPGDEIVWWVSLTCSTLKTTERNLGINQRSWKDKKPPENKCFIDRGHHIMIMLCSMLLKWSIISWMVWNSMIIQNHSIIVIFDHGVNPGTPMNVQTYLYKTIFCSQICAFLDSNFPLLSRGWFFLLFGENDI